MCDGGIPGHGPRFSNLVAVHPHLPAHAQRAAVPVVSFGHRRRIRGPAFWATSAKLCAGFGSVGGRALADGHLATLRVFSWCLVRPFDIIKASPPRFFDMGSHPLDPFDAAQGLTARSGAMTQGFQQLDIIGQMVDFGRYCPIA